jgi:hypothetical protein
LIPANAQIRSHGVATAASTIALLAIIVLGGCHHEPTLPTKPPVAVRLADVTLYQSTEGLQYSASLIPYAQVDLAFRTAGYITEVKQIRSADGRTRDIGTGDYVTRGTSLAQIRIQDLKNQADESGAQVDAAVAQHTQAEQDLNRAKALYATQSLTKPDYDQAQARFDSTPRGDESIQSRAASGAAVVRRFRPEGSFLRIHPCQEHRRWGAGIIVFSSLHHRRHKCGKGVVRCAGRFP